MRLAYERGFDWFWLMDDDTLPEREALAELERGAGTLRENLGKDPLVLASTVWWVDGTLHPMNLPGIKTREYELLTQVLQFSLLSVRFASFVSLLVHLEAVARYGLPIAEYFLWADDVEYTARILKRELGVLVPKSRVLHKTPRKHKPWDGGEPIKFYYGVRNTLWLLLWSDSLLPEEKVKMGLAFAYGVARYVWGKKSLSRLYWLVKGIKDGLRGPRRGGERLRGPGEGGL